MSVGQYNFNTITRGDTLPATGFTISTSDPVAVVDLTGAAIKVTFLKDEVLIEKSIGTGITVADPTTGYFLLDSFAFDLWGMYDYDIEITYANGDIATIIRGHINVIKDVSI
jgi:hypothetical protein